MKNSSASASVKADRFALESHGKDSWMLHSELDAFLIKGRFHTIEHGPLLSQVGTYSKSLKRNIFLPWYSSWHFSLAQHILLPLSCYWWKQATTLDRSPSAGFGCADQCTLSSSGGFSMLIRFICASSHVTQTFWQICSLWSFRNCLLLLFFLT